MGMDREKERERRKWIEVLIRHRSRRPFKIGHLIRTLLGNGSDIAIEIYPNPNSFKHYTYPNSINITLRITGTQTRL